jgi:hypothetical protein
MHAVRHGHLLSPALQALIPMTLLDARICILILGGLFRKLSIYVRVMLVMINSHDAFYQLSA